LKQVLRLFQNTYRLFWNDKVAVILTFIVPLVLMSLFGSIFGGSGSAPEGIRLAVLNQSTSSIAQRIESTLDTMKAFRLVKTHKNDAGQEVPFDTTSIKEYVRTGNASAALVFPPDAYTDTSMGLSVKFYYDPKNEIETQTVQGLVLQALYSQMPSLMTQSAFRQASRYLGMKPGEDFRRGISSLVGKYFKIDTSLFSNPNRLIERQARGDSSQRGANFLENMIHIEREQLVGKEMQNPWATRSVGGWAMTFLLFTVTAASSSLFDERKSGVMLRLLTSPVSRVQILWSKYLFNMSLGVIQLLFMFGAGWLMFQVDIFSNFFNLILIVIAASVACTSFGMLLASVSQTRQQANGLGTLLILSMSAVGGAWFPTSFMPPTIQFFSKLTIVYWSMDGFLQVLWRGAGTSAIVLNIAILLGIGAVVNAFSVWRFRTGHIFD
jgi:ABC-2 type transport system permease protein